MPVRQILLFSLQIEGVLLSFLVKRLHAVFITNVHFLEYVLCSFHPLKNIYLSLPNVAC